jgi:hypothetical protein
MKIGICLYNIVTILWSVIIDGVWIGNGIYWALTDRNYK